MKTVYVIKALDNDTSNVEVTCVIASKKEARKIVKQSNKVSICFGCGASKFVRYGECEYNRNGHVPDYDYWYQPVPMLS